MSGGRTMVLSMVFITSFQSSFSTRFRTVFSQILANRVRLGGETEVRERGHHPLRTSLALQGEHCMVCKGKADSGALGKMPGPHGEGRVATESLGHTWQVIQI